MHLLMFSYLVFKLRADGDVPQPGTMEFDASDVDMYGEVPNSNQIYNK